MVYSIIIQKTSQTTMSNACVASATYHQQHVLAEVVLVQKGPLIVCVRQDCMAGIGISTGLLEFVRDMG